MLSLLTIKNYALIKELSFTPQQGLNTITGETGAGKSILLGALGLITGKRADTSVLLDKKTKCIVEACFETESYNLSHLFKTLDLDYDKETIIRREISPAGKSRAFVNDTPVTLDILKKLGVKLIDVHSQNETIQLNNQAYQSAILDHLTNSRKVLITYQQKYKILLKLKKELDDVINSAEKQKSELDYNQFLFDELVDLDLENTDEEVLENEVKTIENFTEIKSGLSEILSLLSDSEQAISNTIGQAVQISSNLATLSPNLKYIETKLNELFYEQDDLSKEVTNSLDNLDLDEDAIEGKKDLYDTLQDLFRKHKVKTCAELQEIKTTLEEKTVRASNIETEIEDLQKALKEEEKGLLELAEKLHSNRNKGLDKITNKIASICNELGMPETTFHIQFDQLETLGNNGLYDIKFMFSANKGIPVEEISKVASGGEFSRLMFAVKSILATKTHLPTIIFDEIDTGISGEIALKMGTLMQKMSGKHQLICITHLPQIASKGSNHFFVYKDSSGVTTTSNIRLLEPEERTTKVAEMIAGSNPGETALQSAKELLAQ